MRTRFKVYIALLAFSATLAAGRLAGPSLMDWCRRRLQPQEPATPPVDEWPTLQLTVDPTLHCPTPEICTGKSHLGARVAPVAVARLFREFDAVLAANNRRFIRMGYGNGYSGERFELALTRARDGAFQVGVLGRSSVDFGPPFTSVLEGLTGTLTLNTLDWREHEPIHVRFELRYYYDNDPAKWSTIEVCSETMPTREE